MISRTPRKVTKLKKAVYMAASVILGLFLAYLAHAAIEINYLNRLAEQGNAAQFFGGCALPPLLSLALWLAGAVGGYFFGRVGWRKVYVEQIWFKK